MKNGKCSKRYPQTFTSTTNVDENSYPLYRRRNNNYTFTKEGFEFDNRWIVPYNPYLTAKYNAHINVEIATSITSVKYLYKYVYKGGDRAFAEVQLQNDGDHDHQAQQSQKDETKTLMVDTYLLLKVSSLHFYLLFI